MQSNEISDVLVNKCFVQVGYILPCCSLLYFDAHLRGVKAAIKHSYQCDAASQKDTETSPMLISTGNVSQRKVDCSFDPSLGHEIC